MMDTAGYLTELKKLLNDVIKESVKSGSDGSESDFVDRGKFYLERLMLGEYIGQGRFFNRRSKDQANLEKTWEEIRPEIEQHIAEMLKKCRSRKMVTEIRQLTAQTLIKEAINKAELKCLIVPQTYRAKVAVRLGRNNKFVFYISYKRTAEDLERCIPAVKTMIEMMENLGSLASIQKMQPYENW
jgi:hypothetical protein